MPRRKGQKVRTKAQTQKIVSALEDYILENGETTLKELLEGPGAELGLSMKKASDKITIPKWLKKSERVEWSKKGRTLVFSPPEETVESEAPEGSGDAPQGADTAADGYSTLPVVAVPDDMLKQIQEVAQEHEVTLNEAVQVLLHFGLISLKSTLESHSESYTFEHGEGREFTESHSMRYFSHAVKGLYRLFGDLTKSE